MPSIFFHTFGCKVNQYESESMRQKLEGLGYRLTSDFRRSDVCVVNSCSVTAEADKKCRKFVRRVLRENASGRILVTGCYATRDPAALRRISPRLEVYANQEKDLIPEMVSGCSLGSSESPLLTFFGGHTRAFVKVQDGCDATCTYCIIPKVRPKMTSRPLEEVVREVEGLTGRGTKEIVLTGIRLGSYGLASSGGRVGRAHGNLADLLRRLIGIPRDFRIRLSSLEITEVTDELLEVASSSEKICRHFHLPLQSGDDAVLRRMGRWYTRAFFEERLIRLREALPDVGVTSDVIVGFPEESEAEFAQTADFIQKHLNGLHVFPFSAREGTGAIRLPRPCPPRVIRARVAALLDLDRKIRCDFRNRFAGHRRRVLAESGGGFTDNGIRVDPPLPIPEGALDWVTLSRAA